MKQGLVRCDVCNVEVEEVYLCFPPKTKNQIEDEIFRTWKCTTCKGDEDI